MAQVFQLVVEGQRDVLVLKQLLKKVWPDLTFDWRGKQPFYHCIFPNGNVLCIRELNGYQRLQNVGSELSRIKELGACSIAKNMLVLDADTQANCGGFGVRAKWVWSTLSALPPHAPVELFLLPDNKSDGTLETLLLQARAAATKSAEGCLQAFCECLNTHNVKYPLGEKAIFSLYAWLFDKTAAAGGRVDAALESDAVVDFMSQAFAPLRTFLSGNLTLL